MADKKYIDDVTGVETTGHTWDGDLRELNKPLPRWWLYVWFASIVWAFGYWVFYPTWPMVSGYTKGIWDYSQRGEVTKEVADAKVAQEKFRQAIASTPLADVAKDPELLQFAQAGGAAIFSENCAGCHGRGAQGGVGYPNLNDDDWLWGGTLDQIQQTISHGIRSGDPKAHESQMPRFGIDGMLTPEQIAQADAYVRSLSGLSVDAKAAEAGKTLFTENCAACHGEDGKGNQEMGAPNLTDGIWLYGDTPADVATTIRTGRGGVMPAWEGRLDPVSIKMLALYVHALGGGK